MAPLFLIFFLPFPLYVFPFKLPHVLLPISCPLHVFLLAMTMNRLCLEPVYAFDLSWLLFLIAILLAFYYYGPIHISVFVRDWVSWVCHSVSWRRCGVSARGPSLPRPAALFTVVAAVVRSFHLRFPSSSVLLCVLLFAPPPHRPRSSRRHDMASSWWLRPTPPLCAAPGASPDPYRYWRKRVSLAAVKGKIGY